LLKVPLISLISLLCISTLEAFTFSPISQDFSVEGKSSSHVFTITNDSLSERIAVKVSVKKRLVDQDGVETLEECPGDFSIYPSQSILAPGDVKNVRIKWTGGPVSNQEKAYRVIAEQLPVDFKDEEKKEEGGGIRFTYRYEGSLYVVPENAQPLVELISIESVLIEEKSYLKLTFDNRGGRHALLGELTLTLTSRYGNFEPILYTTAELKGVAGENILAGNKRNFLIPEPPEVKGEELLWEMSYNSVY
jgi:fimbrial chaperone protein